MNSPNIKVKMCVIFLKMKHICNVNCNMGAKSLYYDSDVKYSMEFQCVLGSVIKLYIFRILSN